MEPWIKILKVKEAKAILAGKGVDASNVCEKIELLKLVAEHCATQEEAQALMAAPTKAPTAANAGVAAGSTPEKAATAKAALAAMKNMPAKQMKYQAAVMQRDPAYVKRQAKGQLDGASEAEVKACGEELAALAKTLEGDPKEAARLQAESSAMSMVDTLIHNPAQAKKFLQSQPAVAKTLGNNSKDLDEQIDALSQFAKTNEALFKKFILVVVKIGRTFTSANELLNGATGGRAKYVWGLVALGVAYLWFKISMVVVAFFWRHTVGRVWGGGGGSSGGADPLSLEAEDMYGGGAPADFGGDVDGDFGSDASAPAAKAPPATAADEFDEF